MGKLVEIPDCIWMRMTKEQKEEYYKQQKKSNIFVGITAGITIIISITILFVWWLKGKQLDQGHLKQTHQVATQLLLKQLRNRLMSSTKERDGIFITVVLDGMTLKVKRS